MTNTQKKTTSSTTQTSSSSSSKKSTGGLVVSNFMNILAFVAVCVGGIAMFLATILRWFGLTASWINSMQAIANAIGWLALCLLSVRYIRKRKDTDNCWWYRFLYSKFVKRFGYV